MKYLYFLIVSLSILAGQGYGQIGNETVICELLKRPSSFLGLSKEIYVWHVVGFEYFRLEGDCECKRQKYELFKIGYQFDPAFKDNSDADTYAKFEKLVANRAKMSSKVRSSVHGKFEVEVKRYETNNPLDVRYEYTIWIKKAISVSATTTQRKNEVIIRPACVETNCVQVKSSVNPN